MKKTREGLSSEKCPGLWKTQGPRGAQDRDRHHGPRASHLWAVPSPGSVSPPWHSEKGLGAPEPSTGCEGDTHAHEVPVDVAYAHPSWAALGTGRRGNSREIRPALHEPLCPWPLLSPRFTCCFSASRLLTLSRHQITRPSCKAGSFGPRSR